MVTVIGKIEKITLGSYDNRFGIKIIIEGPGWGVIDFIGLPARIHPEERGGYLGDAANVLWWASKTITEAKKTSLDELNGIPVEATFDSAKLVSWRILHEVL